MEIREFFRKHLLKVFVAFIVLQLIIFAFIQRRNHSPEATADYMEVVEDKTAKVSPLVNDADKDEKDSLRLARVLKPLHGSVNQKRNILVYTPNKNFTGKDSLGYTVTDGRKESEIAYIVFQVLKNQTPVTNQDKATVYEGGTTVVWALDNDSDNERDSLVITGTTQPLHGTVSIAENKLVYTAGSSAALDSFFYTASDGKNISQKTPVKIEILKKSNPCYPWLYTDIGESAISGKVICNNGTMKIQAAGTDIWNNADGFYFIYQRIKGNFEISVKVESLEGPHEWTKSGLMVRENLGAGAKNAFIGVTTKNGITTQARFSSNDFAENGERKGDLKAPYWIKLIREADSCKYAVSPDGIKWQPMESKKLLLPADVYVGMAITSHDSKAICSTSVRDYKLKAK